MLDRINNTVYIRKHGWPKTLSWAAAFLFVSLAVIDPFVLAPIVDRLPDRGDSVWWILAPWVVIVIVWWITIRHLRRQRRGD